VVGIALKYVVGIVFKHAHNIPQLTISFHARTCIKTYADCHHKIQMFKSENVTYVLLLK